MAGKYLRAVYGDDPQKMVDWILLKTRSENGELPLAYKWSSVTFWDFFGFPPWLEHR